MPEQAAAASSAPAKQQQAVVKSASSANFSKKLDEIEAKLSSSGQQWLSGQAMPGKIDAEAFEAVKAAKPEPRVYPHAFGWACMISKFSPEKQASWK